MRRRIVLTLAAAATLATLTAAAPASSGQICYDLDVNVAGNQLVDEAGCQELPTP